MTVVCVGSGQRFGILVPWGFGCPGSKLPRIEGVGNGIGGWNGEWAEGGMGICFDDRGLLGGASWRIR